MLTSTTFTICEVPTCTHPLLFWHMQTMLRLKQHFQHFFQIIFLYSVANTSKSHPSFLPQECRGSRALKENWATQERLGLLETEVQQSHFNLKFRFDMQFNTVSCQSQCFSSPASYLSIHLPETIL